MDKIKKEFSKIYDQYIEKIYRFIFLKVDSKEIAEDLTSETFLRAWEVFKNQKIENISAFLYQTAKNLIVDFYREREKTKIVSLKTNNFVNDSHQNFEQKIKLSFDLERIKKALKELNEDYQNAIIWRYIDGLSIREVAKLLNKTEGATRVLLHRALEALRNKIEKV